MIICQFIFTPGEYDEDFHVLDDQIDAYMELKWEEVYNWEHQPAPIEYKMYYSI